MHLNLIPELEAIKRANTAKSYRIGAKISRIVKWIAGIVATVFTAIWVICTVIIMTESGYNFIVNLSWYNPQAWEALNAVYVSTAVVVPTLIAVTIVATVAKIICNKKEKWNRNMGYYLQNYLDNKTHDELLEDIKTALKRGEVKEHAHLNKVYEEIKIMLRYAPKSTSNTAA